MTTVRFLNLMIITGQKMLKKWMVISWCLIKLLPACAMSSRPSACLDRTPFPKRRHPGPKGNGKGSIGNPCSAPAPPPPWSRRGSAAAPRRTGILPGSPGSESQKRDSKAVVKDHTVRDTAHKNSALSVKLGGSVIIIMRMDIENPIESCYNWFGWWAWHETGRPLHQHKGMEQPSRLW